MAVGCRQGGIKWASLPVAVGSRQGGTKWVSLPVAVGSRGDRGRACNSGSLMGPSVIMVAGLHPPNMSESQAISPSHFILSCSMPRLCAQILEAGISVDGQRYRFIGCSNAQLRNKTCWLVAADSPDEVEDMLKAAGSFSGEGRWKGFRTFGLVCDRWQLCAERRRAID